MLRSLHSSTHVRKTTSYCPFVSSGLSVGQSVPGLRNQVSHIEDLPTLQDLSKEES
jgi:hypothetical protein